MAGECIHCGKCLEVCPLINATHREELGPRAKAGLCRMLETGDEALSEASVAQLAGMCLGCHRCRSVCSQGVNVPAMVTALRGAHPDLKSWLWKTWLVHARELWGTGSMAAKLLPEKFRPEKFGSMLKMLAGLKGGAGLKPFVSCERFSDEYRGEKMLLFAGCTAHFVQMRWLATARRLLDGLGVDVLPGDFACCGGGLKSAGCTDEARAMAERNVQVWRAAGRPKIVTFCASCRSGLEGYDFFLGNDEKELWGKSIFPVSNLLHSSSFIVKTESSENIGYHRPCHADEADSDRVLLDRILGKQLSVGTGRDCCGFGGILRLGAPQLGNRAGEHCLAALADCDSILTGCSGCVAQLKALAQGGRVGHWLEILL